MARSSRCMGSNLNSRTDSLGQQSGTFDIAQAKLEIGSFATDWEPYNLADELVKCQRYCEKSYDLDTAPGTATSACALYFSYIIADTTGGENFKVNKAYLPTVTLYSIGGAINNIRTPGTPTDVPSTTLTSVGQTGFANINATGVTTAGGYGHFVARAYL